MFRMFASSHQLQVLQAIVQRVLVDVVNDLSREQPPLKTLLHDVPVFRSPVGRCHFDPPILDASKSADAAGSDGYREGFAATFDGFRRLLVAKVKRVSKHALTALFTLFQASFSQMLFVFRAKRLSFSTGRRSAYLGSNLWPAQGSGQFFLLFRSSRMRSSFGPSHVLYESTVLGG